MSSNSLRPASYWIHQLNLQPHPEGGYFSETYRSSEQIASAALPARYHGNRSFATAIYFLVEGGSFSALHHIASGPEQLQGEELVGTRGRHIQI